MRSDFHKFPKVVRYPNAFDFREKTGQLMFLRVGFSRHLVGYI